MNTNNQLQKYKNHPIKKWFTNIFDKIKSRIVSSKLWDKNTEDEINRQFPNELEQKEVKKLLKELLTRNNNLLETLNIRMLDKEFVDLFGKVKLERIITDELLQEKILELSWEELQTYAYILNYNNDRADFNMILTSLDGIYDINHNYDDLKADWDRADKNHTISCSYIGNDFLGVVDESYLLAFSDIRENELLQAKNEDAGTVDYPFNRWEDLWNNKFLTPKEEINTSKLYNELLVERKVETDGKLVNRMPTFAVFIAETIEDINNDKNHRWQETKRIATELGIPIAVIDGT